MLTTTASQLSSTAGRLLLPSLADLIQQKNKVDKWHPGQRVNDEKSHLDKDNSHRLNLITIVNTLKPKTSILSIVSPVIRWDCRVFPMKRRAQRSWHEKHIYFEDKWRMTNSWLNEKSSTLLETALPRLQKVKSIPTIASPVETHVSMSTPMIGCIA